MLAKIVVPLHLLASIRKDHHYFRRSDLVIVPRFIPLLWLWSVGFRGIPLLGKLSLSPEPGRRVIEETRSDYAIVAFQYLREGCCTVITAPPQAVLSIHCSTIEHTIIDYDSTSYSKQLPAQISLRI